MTDAGTHAKLLRGSIVTPDRIIDDGILEIAGTMIRGVAEYADWSAKHPAVDPPPSAGLLLPGLVDIHCHGGGGATFTNGDTDDAMAAARHHHRHGSTNVVASLVTAAADDLVAQVGTLSELVHEDVVAGVHLEGPFLSVQCCGAQDPRLIIDPDTHVVERLLKAADGTIAMATVAPERPGYADVAQQLREHGVVVALGHSAASYETFSEAIEALGGSAVVTHLANGMPPFHHRSAGPVGASLVAGTRRAATLELIADGQHTDAGFVQLCFATAGATGIALVTDAMAAAGMPDGDYVLGSQRVGVRDGVARLAAEDGGYGSIAGGTSHLIEDVARCVNEYGIGMVDAVRAASATPAAAIGIADTCGALARGRVADVLVADERLEPIRVLRRGEWLAGPGNDT